MGGGPSSQTSDTTTKIPAWAQPYASQLLNTSGNYFPSVGQQPPQQQVAGFSGMQGAGLAGIKNQTGTAQGIADQGAGMLNSTLAGNYLDPSTNPWLKKTFDEANQALGNQYNQITAPSTLAAGQQASGGGPGVGANSTYDQLASTNEQNLAQAQGNLATNIYGGNYANERANQMNALGLVGQTQSNLYNPSNQLIAGGSLVQGQQQNTLNAQYQNQMNTMNQPFNRLNQLGSVFGQAVGGTGSQISVSPNSGATK